MRHLCGPMILVATILCIGSAATEAQEAARPSGSRTVDGNAVLAGRGLARVGYMYLLKEEMDSTEAIQKGLDDLKQLEARGRALQETIAQDKESLASTGQDLRAQQQQRDNLNLEKQRLNNQLIYYTQNQNQNQDTNTRIFIGNQIQDVENQLRSKKDSIDRLNQTFSLAQLKLQNDQTSHRDLEASYQSQKSSYENRFGSLRAKYDPFKSDPEIIEALKQLNRSARPWVMIGPQWEYDNNVKSLAQGILKGAGLEVTYTTVTKRVGNRTTKHQIPRASLVRKEKEVHDVGYQARLLESKLTGPQGAANLQKMSTAVAQLKKGVGEVEEAYAELNKDPLFASAATQFAPGATIEPTDDFKNYVKRLPELEKALSTKK